MQRESFEILTLPVKGPDLKQENGPPGWPPPSRGIMRLASSHHCGFPQSPNPQVTTTAFLLPRGNLQFQKGTESNRKQLVWQNLEKKPIVRIQRFFFFFLMINIFQLLEYYEYSFLVIFLKNKIYIVLFYARSFQHLCSQSH